jgi:nucleobase:cation symporter-1, NCS1 family
VAIGLFYEVTNIAFGTLVVNALFAQAGIELGTASLYVVLAVIAVLCFALPLYGYATIVKLAPWVSAALVIAFIFVGIFVVRAADWGYSPDHVADSSRLPLFLAGCAVVAAGPLSWGTSPDFARYFPATTRKAPVVWWTTFGGFIPTVFLQGIGILAATAMDMNDPEGNIGTIVPGWFTPIFFILVILGQISGNVLTAYSTGLAVQALGVRLSRAKTIVVTGLLATAMAWWCVFAAPHFLDTLYSALAFSGTLLVPLVTIYGVDIVLRRNDYDGMAINDERRGSPFWYTSGYFPAGCIAQTVGTIVGVLCMSNAGVFVGPLAAVFGGADMSIFMGSLVAGALYALLWFKTSPYRDTHLRPGRVQKSFL